jgi:hypothetical protein
LWNAYASILQNSTYPHGGYTFVGLLLSSTAAFTATIYAVTSCRFLVVSFRSATGDFEEYFINTSSQAAGGDAIFFKSGIGLFKWLRPTTVDVGGGESDWSSGACAGYQESMLNNGLSDNPFFGAARLFSVLAVVMALVVFVWTIGTAIFAYNRLQIVVLNACCFMGTACSGLTFLLSRSAMCATLFVSRSCKINEGGLVMIAGIILWIISSLISVAYMRGTPVWDRNLDGKDCIISAEKARLGGQIARRRLEAKAKTRATEKRLSAGTSPSDSFESQNCAIIPMSAKNSSRAEQPLPAVLLVDDVSQPEEMEVLYIQQRRRARVNELGEV